MNHMRTIVQHTPEFAGMALGGIGTGSVEIGPDGRLENWSIFNRGKWASRSPKEDQLEDLPGIQDEMLRFYLRAEEEGKEPVVRKLSYDGPDRDRHFRSAMYSWMKCISEIEWTPDFPAAKLAYRDHKLPVSCEAEFISPFLPHHAQISGTPGFSVHFTVQNESDRPVQVSLLGLMQNPVCRSMERAENRGLCNTVTETKNGTVLTMSSSAAEKLPENGSISLMAGGGEQSFLRSDFEAYLHAYVLGYSLGVTEESCLFDFRKTGCLPNLGWDSLPDLTCFTSENLEKMEEAEIDRWLARVLQNASGAGPWKRLCEVVPSPVESVEGKRNFLMMLAGRYQQFLAPESRFQWGGGALCSSIRLEPGEKKVLTFTVGWYFPNHVTPAGHLIGHQYENSFSGSEEVCTFLAEQEEALYPKVRAFSELLGSTDAPEDFSRGWTAHLNTLIKCSWWDKSGDFGIWEGYGSCGFHTTDITYHGSWGLIALFPELQCRQMRMGAGFQREDGRIPHFFTPDFSAVDNGFERVDMNPQFVLMVCRDYLWTGDRAYLDALWPNVVRAVENTILLDTDGDGLPDSHTGANTYDAWRFRGIPAYIAGLWLGALSAGIRMAEEMQDDAHREKWAELLRRGKESFDKLWNGSYYSLWVDQDQRDECCMSDQLDGLWYTILSGLPGFLDSKRVLTAMDSILKWNFSDENGLINASYPAGALPTLYTHQNVQALANWSGVEYAFSSLLLEYGRYEDACRLASAVEERYRYAGRIFNHEECGDYYYRPLSSWAMMLSLSGLRVDAAAGEIYLSPRPQIHTIPWFTASGCGLIERKEEGLTLTCTEGSLSAKTLICGFLPKEVLVNGRALAFSAGQDGTRADFALSEGDVLFLRK